MRTTLTVDDDVLDVAKTLARVRQISVGEALSDLARKGMNVPVGTIRDPNTGWLMFDIPGGQKITTEDVQKALEEDDLWYMKFIRRRP